MANRESASVIAKSASAWIVRLDRGLSDEEQAAFEAWVAADTRHRGALARVQALWLQADRTQIYRGGASTDGTRAPPHARVGAAPWVWAAGILLFLSASLVGWRSYSEIHFATTVGEIRHVTLADGSNVTLDTDSRITIDYSRGVRLIRLDQGEALFEVAHDSSRPFVVQTGALRVRAVGTAFLVRRDERSNVEVTVARGAVDVWLQTSSPEPATRLAAGRRAVATQDNLGPPQTVSAAQMAQALAWQDGVIDLDGRTLAEAAREFNRYNEQRVVVDDDTLAAERVVGRFSVSDPIGFATAAAAMLDARVRIDKGEIVLEAGKIR